MDPTQKLITQYPEISSAPTHFKTSVLWGDVDMALHVNNIIYLKWSETARVQYFDDMKMDTSFSGDAGPILGWQDGKYLYPVTYPDEVLVTALVTEILSDRFIMECRVYSLQAGRLAAISKQHIVPYSYTERKKIPIPINWLEGIKLLQPKSHF